MAQFPYRPKVFLDGPYDQGPAKCAGSANTCTAEKYQVLIDFFESEGWNVLSVHRGLKSEEQISPSTYTTRAFRWMHSCDLFVALPGSPAFTYTHVAMGWASALRRPMILILDACDFHTQLTEGLKHVTPLRHLVYEDTPAFFRQLRKQVKTVTCRTLTT